MKLPFSVDLKGKIAIVTGGGGVLGGALAEALGKCNAKVVVLNRTKEKADKVVQKIMNDGGQALSVGANVLDKKSLEEARQEIIQRFGTCDILVNAAGGNHPDGITTKEYFEKNDLLDDNIKTFFDLTVEGVGFVFDLNFMGTLIPSQIFAQDMIDKEDASIVNISSMAAYSPMTKVPAYCGAKAAITNFTNWLAVHMSKTGIRVNAIAPGFFQTVQNKDLLTHKDGSYTDRAKKILSNTPLERFGNPEELVGTLLWLVQKEASSFVTGIVVPVDGGFQAYSGV
ncbi:MAG: SDR family oxidoreductase [Clostridia bacterium]|nr:SDR family oxidoreductase [Clostridia bacterium]